MTKNKGAASTGGNGFGQEASPEEVIERELAAKQRLETKKIRQLVHSGQIKYPFIPPDQVPYGFIRINTESHYSQAYLGTRDEHAGLLVMSSIELLDGIAWYHVGLERENDPPTVTDFNLVRNYWFGSSMWAIGIYPPVAQSVEQIHFSNHLWHCLESFPLPRIFTQSYHSTNTDQDVRENQN